MPTGSHPAVPQYRGDGCPGPDTNAAAGSDRSRGRPKHPDTPHEPTGILSAVIESLPAALAVFDRNLELLLRNSAARALFADSTDAAKALAGLSVDGEFRDWGRELREVIDGRAGRRFDTVVRPAADQPEVFLSIAVTPLRDLATGSILGGLILAEDVSSRISMEQRLAVSERLAAVGKLAARVAHELNNPLDGIMRYTNLALRLAGDSRDDKLAGYLEQARSGLTRMAQITSALLEFSRTAHTHFEQATINKIVDDAVAAMGGRAQDKGVTVVCSLHRRDMPVVRGSSLFQVFCNLIKNAIDAMPDGGTLTVTTGLVGPDVVVTFEDTGVGLPKEADRIFEPFFTTKPPGEGTGLGLAVCREMIQRYSGSITAADRPTQGAVMTVTIPKRNCAAVPITPRRGPGSAIHTSPDGP